MNKDDICARIPHAGSMCLLERVEHWDENEIRCLAQSHGAPDNPLRSAERLAAVVAIEYAGQAIALHGGLLQDSDGPPRTGYLASVRNIVLARQRLDRCAGALQVQAKRLAGDRQGYLYEFDVACEGDSLVSGRIMVKLIDDTETGAQSA